MGRMAAGLDVRESGSVGEEVRFEKPVANLGERPGWPLSQKCPALPGCASALEGIPQSDLTGAWSGNTAHLAETRI